MWCPFVINQQMYSLKYDAAKGTFYITNFKFLWTENIDKVEIIDDFKALNALYNAEDEEIYNVAIKILQNVQLVTEVSFSEDDKCIISYKTKLESLPINCNYKLHKSDQNSFFEEITIPLLKTVQFLELKKNKFSEQLEKKDYELQEYQMEFGEITRKNIMTEKHIKDDGNTDSILFLNLFNQSAFSDLFGKNHGDLKDEYPELQVKSVKNRKLKLPSACKKRRF